MVVARVVDMLLDVKVNVNSSKQSDENINTILLTLLARINKDIFLSVRKINNI